MDSVHEHFLWNCSQINATEQYTCGDKSTLIQIWFGAIKQQTITWANVDPALCCHKASLGHNELIGFTEIICNPEWE